jgi:hypothetical protein
MNDVAQVPSPPAEAADRPGRDRLWHPRPVLCAVCTATHPWFRLVRSAPAEAAPRTRRLVLLDGLPVGLLDAQSKESD